jgi:hypothetical protein
MTQSFSFWRGHGRATYEQADVVVGDRLVPSEISVEIRGGTSEPDLSMKIEVRQGIPVWTEVTLRARPDGPEVRDKDLSHVNLNGWIEQIVAACSYRYSGGAASGHEFWGRPADDQGELANVRRVRSGRTRVSAERLRKVAEIYRDHFTERPTDSVARSFGVSHRTAARYVQQARSAGFLPPTDPGKKKA